MATRVPLSEALFENPFPKTLKGDPLKENYVRNVPYAHFSRVSPTPVVNPVLLAWTEDLAATLNLSRPDTKESLGILAGNHVSPSMQPYAMRYGGHQFGAWAGQLGDGRAINLGSIAGSDGKAYELQLKGAGPTPYSRHADGRAVLRSSLREFLCSEAMYHLGVPTTRALSLVLTGEGVVRDMFYDGNPKEEAGAIVCRVAPTFLRFGNFEILAEYGEIENLRSLADYAIKNYFPELGVPNKAAYLAWFETICKRTALMVAHWMSVGFVHGVMNTDNMSILGITIDYGPYGWLEPYEPGWTPNTTDFGQKRYAYGRQPDIALWNLARFAESLVPLLDETDRLESALAIYRDTFGEQYYSLMAKKLGFTGPLDATIKKLITDLATCFEELKVDMTVFFRQLSGAAALLHAGHDVETGSKQLLELLLKSSYEPQAHAASKNKLNDFLLRYLTELKTSVQNLETTRQAMDAVNPKYVLRNYLAFEAAERCEKGDNNLLQDLIMVLTDPFAEHPQLEHLASKRPDWAATKPGCSALSCSS